MRSQLSLEANWDKGNKVVPAKAIIKAIQDGLHETMQEKIDLKYKEYCLVNDERFSDYLDNIEKNKMRRRETLKRARGKFKYSSGSNDNSDSSSERIPKKKRKGVRKTSQGKARI